ncbi:MAG: O-antigen ligase family protein [Acidobacteria bacterium]|nr:O-antigen ligase family protein [Acidobacteriota bacterium]
MKGLILAHLVTWIGAAAALRYPLIGLNVYVGLAILRPQFIFGFAGDLTGLSWIVGVAVLIGWALQGFGSWKFGKAWPVIVPLLAFVGWYALSAALALEPEISLATIEGLAKLVLPVLVGLTLMKRESEWRPMLWTIVLAQGYVGFEMNSNYLIKGYNTAAIGFGGMDNNFFGASLVTSLGPAVTLMISSRTWRTRALAGLAAAFILHTILLTFSRGAMVGLLAVGVVAFVMMPKRPLQVGALAATALVALYFTGPELLSRYATTFVSEGERDSSAESRLDLWRDCLQVANDYPAFGVGPANWRVIAARYGWPAGKSAHSVWMETAAELGYPGAFWLLAFFLIAAIRLWPVARSTLTPDNRYAVVLASGVVLGIVGFVVSGQFVSAPGLEPPYYLAMLGAAMLKHHGARTADATAGVPAAIAATALPSATARAAAVMATVNTRRGVTVTEPSAAPLLRMPAAIGPAESPAPAPLRTAHDRAD